MQQYPHLISAVAAFMLALSPFKASAEDKPTYSYVRPDGAIPIIGNDDMATLLNGLNALVSKDHPGLRFEMTLKGSSTAIPALSAGATLFAPMGREAWKSELGGFKQIHGYFPTAVRIGYSGWGPRSGNKTPSAVYVNAANPVTKISLDMLCGAAVAGYKDGDINTWGQIGRNGADGERRVHVYGLRDNGGFATFFRDHHCGGLPFAAKYEPLETKEAIIKAVAEDPFGIGFIGWFDAEKVSKNIRILALSEKGFPAALPSKEDVSAGRYPLSQAVELYIDKAPDKPLDPLVKAYLQVVLSDEGQALVGKETDKEFGYVPLSKADLEVERAKVDKL